MNQQGYKTASREANAFHEGAPGVSVAGLGDAALAAPVAGGVLRGREPQVGHQFPRSIKAGDVSELGGQDGGAGEFHAAQRLEGLDERIEAPALDGVVQLALQALQALVLLRDGAPVFLEDDLLRRGRAHDAGGPPEMGGVPAGAVLVANVVTEQDRLQPALTPLEILQRIVAAATEIPQRLVLEYDLARLKGGVRGKYYKQAAAGTNLVLLEPDVARTFPDSSSVNRALRLLREVATKSSRRSSKPAGARRRATG